MRAQGTLTGTIDNPRVAFSAQAETLQLPGGLELQHVTAKAAGTLAAHEADITARAPELLLEVEARLRGGWLGSRGWIGEILALRNSGEYPLQLTGAPAPLRIAPGRVELGRLEAKLGEGRLLIRDAAWSPERLASSGEVAGLPAQWLIVAAGLDDRLSSTLLIDGDWNLGRTDQIEGVVRLRRAAGDLAPCRAGRRDRSRAAERRPRSALRRRAHHRERGHRRARRPHRAAGSGDAGSSRCRAKSNSPSCARWRARFWTTRHA